MAEHLPAQSSSRSRSIEQAATGERHNTTCPQCKGTGTEATEILVRFDEHRRFLGFASTKGLR